MRGTSETRASDWGEDAPFTRPIRILIVDDHALFRQSLAYALNTIPELSAQSCGSISEGLLLVARHSFELVLLDNDLGATRGVEFVSPSREIGYAGRILVVCDAVSRVEARTLSRQGVDGIFLKSKALTELLGAIRTVMEGGVWLDASLAELHHELASSTDGQEPRLTHLQRHVLRQVLEGLSNKEIGHRLQISESYAKAILQTLFQKTGVRTRGQLVRLAIEEYKHQL